MQGMPPGRQVARQLHGGLAGEDPVDLPRWYGPVDRGDLAAGPVLGLDPDVHPDPVGDVDVHPRGPAGPRDDGRRQDAPPRRHLDLGEGGCLGLLVGDVDAQGGQHRPDGLVGHLDMPAAPVPVVRPHPVCRGHGVQGLVR